MSAAGQNETFLGCATNEDVIKSVVACWASLFTYQSVQYRWQHGLAVDTDIAVVVQVMVPAETAGVLFTCHPTTSHPLQLVITANYGLGEVKSSASIRMIYAINKILERRFWQKRSRHIHHQARLQHQ